MLAIEMEFLLGRYYAADFRDEVTAEWPPHPDRFFSALVAAHHDTFGNDNERRALEWLEALGTPHIAAGEKGSATPVVNFVPTNYDSTKNRSPHPHQRGKQPRSFPVHSPSTPVVQFLWPHAEPDEEKVKAIGRLLERVPAVGRACSLVRLRLANHYMTPNWRPDVRGTEVLRVFGEGRYEELQRRYSIGLRPSLGAQARYSQIETSDPTPKSVFGEMLVMRRIGGRALPIEAALTVTSATRRALMSLADLRGDHELCEYISGHCKEIHCAITALPFAGRQEYADGRLMGVAVVLPRETAKGWRRKVLQLCSGLEKINFRDQEALWDVELSGFDVPRAALRPGTWIRASRDWASVTPVLLDRFPKKNLSVEDLLYLACERAGLPKPVALEHGSYSQMKGVPPVPSFRLQRTKADRPRWGVHVRLQFERPVEGPLLLGAGRFFGLGLLKPLDANESGE